MTNQDHSPPSWNNSNADGATESERYLAKLARRSFLSLWSYSNPYTDEGNGKELCDFMVVFGDDVILFSDKHCDFPTHPDTKVAWYRWYRSAVDKSVRQLAGAASFIDRFPERIYLDAARTCPLPLPLPSPATRRIHLVAVTRGSAQATTNHWGGHSFGSLMLDTGIQLKEHADSPFMIGWPLPNRRFVHVLDELTLDILLTELDTVSDFVAYIRKKELYLSNENVRFIVPGEEELLASYFKSQNGNLGSYSFPTIPPNVKIVMHEEGDWKSFSASDAYASRREANKISYIWDNLIEYQNSHIISGTAGVIEKPVHARNDMHAHERVMRAMAEEGRVVRRSLAEAHMAVLTKNVSEERLVRTMGISTRPERAYVFLTLKHLDGKSYDEYRELRRASLIAYCHASRLKLDNIMEVVGIASEPGSSATLSQEFIFLQFDGPLTPELRKTEIEWLSKVEVWKPEKAVRREEISHEFPAPLIGRTGASLLNRKERRALAKANRRSKQ